MGRSSTSPGEDPDEVRLLRDATWVNQQAIERTIRTWSRGTTWQEMIRTYHMAAVGLGGFVRDPGALVMANPPGFEPALYTQSGSEDFVVEPGMHVMWDCHGTLQHYCWDGGKTWVVDDEPRGLARRDRRRDRRRHGRGPAGRPARGADQRAAGEGRRALRQAGLANADHAFIFFHGLGLEHIDMEITSSRQDWRLEEGMVVSGPRPGPGDDRHRSWLEEIFLVTAGGGDPFFTWGNEPIAGDRTG